MLAERLTYVDEAAEDEPDEERAALLELIVSE